VDTEKGAVAKLLLRGSGEIISPEEARCVFAKKGTIIVPLNPYRYKIGMVDLK
jgi:hypothetical protein